MGLLLAVLLLIVVLAVLGFAVVKFLLWIAMVVTVWSGIEYFVKAFGLLAKGVRTRPIKRAAM